MEDYAPYIAWLQERQDALDRVLAEAGRTYYDRLRTAPNARFDLAAANQESYRLSRGKDLCYDRPHTGLVYGLWYHARRVNTSLTLALPILLEAEQRKVQVYDLGAGSGAFQWALALGCAALKAHGRTPPVLRVINMDTSPFMLHYLEHLWHHLAREIPDCNGISYETHLNTWSRAQEPHPNSWLCASYLFDYENKEADLTRDFDNLIERIGPSRVVLSTSDQDKKVAFMKRIGGVLQQRDYIDRPTLDGHVYTGHLPAVNDFRRHLQRSLNISSIRPVASWDEHSFTGFSFGRRQEGFDFDTASEHHPEEINLFIPHVTDRTQVELSPEQQKAAALNDRPTIIIGPAGCGKSIVITERVKNLVEERDYSQDLHILVTTFNKKLIKDVLRTWLLALLDSSRVSCRPAKGSADETCYNFFFDGCETPNIRLMHFDVLPTRVARVHKWEYDQDLDFCKDPTEIIIEAIEHTKQAVRESDQQVSRFEHVLDPDYVYGEYHRIYFGRLETEKESYYNCARPGRPRLDRDKAPRRLLWYCIQVFLHLCRTKYEVQTPTDRRLFLLDYLKTEEEPFHAEKYETDAYVHRPFTHLFVDELQDCTPTDFDIFYELLTDHDQLVVAGDLAQSIHLGLTSTASNAYRAGTEQRYFSHHDLVGSYRLPFRISEALLPLSKQIESRRSASNSHEKVSLLNPYRGSPPGARPIFVWAPDTEAMATKIAAIYDAYGPGLGGVGFDLDWCSILEKDPQLRRAIDAALEKQLGTLYDKKKHLAETNTILRMKGLEKTCVVWSTRIAPDTEEEAEEFVYTILTRGARLLIVALFADVCDVYKPIINTFEEERIIMWDEETRAHFKHCRADGDYDGEYEQHTAAAVPDNAG